jgi:hypothetical protein
MGILLVFAVNDGGEKLEAVRDLSWINQYVINGVLGEQSKEHELHGQITVKAKYGKLFISSPIRLV